MKKFTIHLFVALTILFFAKDLSLFAQQASYWNRFPEEVKNRNWFKRYEWFMRPRMFPYDTLPIQTFRVELNKEIEKDRLKKGNSMNDIVWQNIGPSGIDYAIPNHWGEVSGRIRGIAVSPIDPNTVYIAVAAGGIWKTTDGGQNWSDIASVLPSLTYGAIAVDPNNPDNIYAGGGEVVYGFNGLIYGGAGLYKSTDSGNSWVQITDSIGDITNFGDIEVSPHNSNIVFAALAGGDFFVTPRPNEGIWRSEDAGLTWTKTLDVVDGLDVIVHPIDPNIVYAATGGGVTTSGFYISTDAGLTWDSSNTGLPPSSTIKRIQISLANSSPSTIFAVIYQESGPNPTVVYKSTNGGSTWEHLSPGTQLGGYDGSSWYDQGSYDLCIAVNPSNEDQVFIGNVELHQTTNGLDFFPKRIPGATNYLGCPTHIDIHKIVFASSNSNIVYIGCDGGIYKSTDAGDNWSSTNNGIRTIQHYRLASHPTNPDILISGAQDNGNFRTLDRGMTIWEYVSGADGMECFFDYVNPNTIYFSIQNGVLCKSYNLGNNFSVIANIQGFWISPFFMHPTNNQWLYAASNHIYRSTNGGVSFDTIAVNAAPEVIFSMAQSKVNPDNMIICGSYNSSFVKVSSDGGFTWNEVTGNIPGDNAVFFRVNSHPLDANTMYLVKMGFSEGNKLFKTTDLGDTWTNISGDLPNVPHSDLFIDPLIPSHYYTANDFGVYESTNEGVNWEREGNGFPFVPVMDFDYVDFGNGQRLLRAGTHGRSIYEAMLPIVTNVGEKEIVKMPTEFLLFQNYPNPFNPITNISYTLPVESQVKLSIYNLLGELVETIVNEKQNARKYDAVWNAGKHPSGVYIYTLDAVSVNGSEQKKISKKMLLLK